jgi:D-glycero-D-manno-heptose 1,7-bisphosphate phosphatase
MQIVANGLTPRATVDEMHDLVRTRLAVDDIKTCFHNDAAGCRCRKPNPGFILVAAAEHDIDLSRSYVLGDRWREIEAGRAAGCTTIFVDYGYPQDRPNFPDKVVKSVAEATRYILTHRCPPQSAAGERDTPRLQEGRFDENNHLPVNKR